MQKPTANYTSYLLRIWRLEEGRTPGWHVYVQDLTTGQRRGFADLESLFAFLEQASAEQPRLANRDEEEGDNPM